MASPEELFRSLVGREPTDRERLQIMTLRGQTDAPDDDVLWVVMIGTGYVATLFEKLPDQVAETINELLTRVRQTAHDVMDAAAHQTQANLVETVRAEVRRVARATVWAEKWKWLTGFAIAFALLLAVAFVVLENSQHRGFQAGLAAGLAKGYGKGYHEGYEKYRKEENAAAWGNTREGQLARRFYYRNPEFFFKLLHCTGEGWQPSQEAKTTWCGAGPYRQNSERNESWRIR